METTTTLTLKLTPHGVNIDEDLTFDQWKIHLSNFKHAKENYINNLSSLIRYGTEKWGAEKIESSLDQLEFDLSDATRALSVSTLPEEFKSRHALTAEHNYILSLIEDEDEREKWAKLTIEHKLKPIELKKSITAGEVITQEQIDTRLGKGTGILTIQGVIFQYKQWERKTGGLEKLIHAPKQEREKFLDEVAPILDLAASILDSLEETK